MNDPITVEKLNIQPPASIYRTFSRYNYKIWYAIAEFVDNSTASFYQHKNTLTKFHQIPLIITIDYDQDKKTLVIKDNAYGMTLKDFRRAILLDAKPETQGGRNEFGMGLKTAASWFGEVWSVSSTAYLSPERYSATVDIPHLAQYNINDVDIIKTDAPLNEHGTTITITHLTKSFSGPKTIKKIKDVLCSMYRRDINSGTVKIIYRNEELSFTPYQVLGADGREERKNLDFTFTFNGVEHHVTGFAAILGPKDSGFKKAGFALFRRDRVVLGSEGDYYKPLTIFGEAQSPVSHKLFGELNLDDFPINQAKDGFVWDDGLEDTFLEALKSEIPDLLKFARKTIKQREANNFDPSNSREEMNEVRDSTRKMIDAFSNQNKSEPAAEEDDDDKFFNENFGADSPNQPEVVYTETTSDYRLAISGKPLTIRMTWTDAGTGYWFVCANIPEGVEIKINIGHPFFKPYAADKSFRDILNRFVLALYLAENDAAQKMNDDTILPDDLNNSLNKILEKIAWK